MSIKDFPRDLDVGDNALVPIVLQGTRADEKVFADFSPREVDFSPEEQTVRLGNLRKRLLTSLMPEMSCFISGVSLFTISCSIVFRGKD